MTRPHSRLCLNVCGNNLNKLTLSYLTDLLDLYNPKRALRPSSQLLRMHPRPGLKTRGDCAFATTAPRLWNNLPVKICISESIQSFKSRLKTHLFALHHVNAISSINVLFVLCSAHIAVLL